MKKIEVYDWDLETVAEWVRKANELEECSKKVHGRDFGDGDSDKYRDLIDKQLAASKALDEISGIVASMFAAKCGYRYNEDTRRYEKKGDGE